ncbi:Phytanoyl-CoA dioxygenase-like protein [Drosera capensis]
MAIICNLSSDQLDFFHTQGSLVLESFASDDEIECLRKRIDELLDGIKADEFYKYSFSIDDVDVDEYYADEFYKYSFSIDDVDVDEYYVR